MHLYQFKVDRLQNQCYAGGGGGGGEGRAWGGDLIVCVGPGVGHLTDLVLPGEEIFEPTASRSADRRLSPLSYM